MAEPGFYDSNTGRAFPFLAGSVDQVVAGPLRLRNLPDPVVVDCGFLVGPQSGFDPARHTVYLDSITRRGAGFTFTFGSDCPGLSGVPLRFVRAWPGPRFAAERADSGETYGSESLSLSGSASLSHSLAVLGTHCHEPLWEGYLVTGDLDALDAFLTGDGTVARQDDDATVEPALVQSLGGALVAGIGLANADRTRATAADGCPDPTWPYPTGHAFIAATCLRGGIVFRAGYNAVVRQGDRDSSITIGAVVGGGAGEPCAEPPLFTGEVVPPGSTLLGGGVRCNETVRAINGMGGPLLRLLAGSGVTITAHPESSTVAVAVDMTGLVTCYVAVSQVSERI